MDYYMSYLKTYETLTEIVSITGKLYDKTAYAFNIAGRRAGFTSITLSNDIKEFDNSVADFPVLAASTLDIISSSANDTNSAGTGVRQVKVVYINSSNALVESPAINLNGTTLVTSVLTGVNEVLWMETHVAGSGAVAAGNIRLRINGGTVEVEQITVGGNKSLSARFMVPAGHTAYIPNWRAHAINDNQNVALKATVNTLDRTLSTAYKVMSSLDVANNANSSTTLLPFMKLPALSRIRVSTISGGAGGTVRCNTNFVVILVQD